MILIVTERLDAHTDFVEQELDKRRLPWQRLHLSDVPARGGGAILLEAGEPGCGWIQIRDRRIELSAIQAVWYRRTEAFDLSDIEDKSYRKFAAAECRHFMRELWFSLAHARWVSPPDAIYCASVKLEQLHRAKRHGFRVPRTLVTNDPAAVVKFIVEIGQPEYVIYKPHTSLIVPIGEQGQMGVAYATPLSRQLIERLPEIRLTPGIFQERLFKRRDLRVTVFGQRAFTVAIESQESAETQDDWRSYSWDGRLPRHVPANLDDQIVQSCIDLTASYGLSYSAIDLVEDRQGRFWFLELNPNGQWAWLQHETQLPMREALVDVLVNKEYSHEGNSVRRDDSQVATAANPRCQSAA